MSRVEFHTKKERKDLFQYMQEFNKELENIPTRNESESLLVPVDDSESNFTAHSNNSENSIV